MRDVLCLGSRAIALVRERLEAPGVLVGRARSDEYRARFDLFASWMIERHGLAAYQHTFPLSREHVGKILGLPPAATQAPLLCNKATQQRRPDRLATQTPKFMPRWRKASNCSPTPWWTPMPRRRRWPCGARINTTITGWRCIAATWQRPPARRWRPPTR